MRIYFETYGCALNKGDTYSMMTLLKGRNHEIVNSEEQADVLVINTCAVRMETEEKMKKRILELSKTGKKLVVAGCLAGAEPGLVMSLAPQSSLIGPQSIGDVVKAVESRERIVSLHGELPSVLPSVFEGLISVIPIADGCAGSCNFCITKLARKELRSYPPRMIVETARKAIEKGAKEIELTGQDTAAYGLDLGRDIRLADLVGEVSSLEGDFMVRVGMMTPELAMRQLDDLLDAWDNPKVYKFFHLPVQSGNDQVLRAMNRKYTLDEFREIVREIRKRFPLVNITTDIIVGHPGEDENAFEDTLNLMKELRFERIHIAMYSLRPNTRSAMMTQVPGPIKKERLKRAVTLYEELSREIHREYVGRKMKVLVLENGKDNTKIGRTLNYIPVIVKDADLGKWYEAEITDSSFFDLRGSIV
ncbi:MULTISPECIES: tRNA (N(6)-L-threonylcarbamoyladenosine(37)-C(2))-methylthiotransferase [Metallosphaera]|uniref:tRNA-t(6)A37 methylthiotransferase n=3 Tax=Metallosphaera TaxID=41980 RepID=A4YEI0_METS5|nr:MULTISPECIES: tRNA (N(6)-L-threonylcarbamoyladenosine(37)-C(2))-methylthiotransferase [Metallosphaera]ABP94832.1 RNA modification enzyme, MiaB family [Metallosphaera sedula DSM 5348]AIM26819.1 RNA modification enzyme, MiaB family [Metallosphaera sedula]AKV73768.1 2-methylthioadenine synthetase [Metallosphaera sedula]AKV76008.1 2-methylthioadenine synthetase [Metallosphaera sedula]AKV78259.1 2-methylthioadenine synthetase [Metallosphaera sedula]